MACGEGKRSHFELLREAAPNKEHPIHSLVVSDRSALTACERFPADHRMLVEPACGANLAAVYEEVPELREFGRILVIACGGVTCTIDQIREWAARCV